MSDFESSAAERLRAANPVASATYEHADFNAMMRRIMKQPRRGALTFAKGFRLKMASAVGASALVTAGGIALLTGIGTSLPILELGVAHSAQAPSSFSSARSSTALGTTGAQAPTAMIYRVQPTYFVAGNALSSATSSAPVYFETAPRDIDAALEQISGALGLGTSTPVTDDYSVEGSVSATIAFSNGAQLFGSELVPNSGEVDWTYSPATCLNTSCSAGCVVTSPPSTSSAISGPVTCLPVAPTYPSDTQSLALAQTIMSRLSTTVTFANPTVSEGDVTYPLEVGNNLTNASDNFQFAADGSLSGASGIITNVLVGDSYPLVSPVAGVSILQSQYGAGEDFTGGTGSSAPTPVTSPSTNDTTTTLAPVTITLTSDVIIYEEYTLADGRSAWLPTYQYGDDRGDSWTVLAVDPQYIQLASSGSSGGAVPNGVY